jgi:tetratricopeptide (TPR) repeat protein
VLTSKQGKSDQVAGFIGLTRESFQMFSASPSHRLLLFAIGFALTLICCSPGAAQTDDITGGEIDPIKLFERGQNAHAKGDVARALTLYEEAIKLRPEFPEAEYQRGVALVALNRLPEAEAAFRRAIDLRKDWASPFSALGNLLARLAQDKEAEPLLRRALQLGATDSVTLDSLSTVRFRAGDKDEALSLARRATEDENASAFAWTWRAAMERATGNAAAAATSINRSLQIEPKHVAALKERAELRADVGDYEHAIDDLKAALAIRPGDKEISLRLAKFYELAGKTDEARTIYEAFGQLVESASAQSKGIINVIGTPEEISAANSDDLTIAQPALEKLILKHPNNPALPARLGELIRTGNPQKSLEYYARANKLDPSNPNYATGYAAALIQSRRFNESVPILRRVIDAVPNDYPAHANLATALYEMKNYGAALPEYEWLAAARPEIAATYFFIATAHDNLGEYRQALDAYEKFLSRAKAAKNQLEIDKVNLRLPRLRDQIKRGQGTKPKKM